MNFDVSKKIIIVSPSLVGGGAEKVAVNLSNEFFNLGFKVDLVVFDLKGPYIDMVIDGVNLINLDVSRTRYAVMKLRGIYIENKGAVSLSVKRDCNIISGLASIGLDVSIYFREANTLDSLRRKNLFYIFLYKMMMRFSYALSVGVIANSFDTRKDLVNEYIINPEKIHVIRNPVLNEKYVEMSLEPVDDSWGFERNVKTVISVGRLHPQKNFKFLISAFKEVYNKNENYRLVIIGEGEEYQNLMQQVSESGLSSAVKILSFKKNIYPYYKKSDVFALSSDWEGFGNVLVEALALGLPVVSTDCPGGPRMILKNGEFGTLVPLGDKKRYVEAIIKSLESYEKRNDYVEYAKTFTVNSVAQDYLAVMNLGFTE